jgi:hypothetical protein
MKGEKNKKINFIFNIIINIRFWITIATIISVYRNRSASSESTVFITAQIRVLIFIFVVSFCIMEWKQLCFYVHSFCSVCFVLFCFVLFCFVLFCFVLFCFVLFCFVLFCFVLFRFFFLI